MRRRGPGDMQLSYDQKRFLYEQGYLLVPGVAPRVMVDAALRLINHSVGQGMEPERMVVFRTLSFCPEVQQHPAIVGLLRDTPGWSLAESAVGAGKLRPVTAAQIALRFPSLQDPPPALRPHLDGMHAPHNGVPEGEIRNFTLLAAILLSDLPGPSCGNFTVWPGTHRLFERYFREHGPQALLHGMPPVEMPEPLQITGRAGDLVLAHYETAHTAATNTSPHVRYACFFRLTHVEHEARKWECMTDIWLEWEGMAAFRAAAGVGAC